MRYVSLWKPAFFRYFFSVLNGIFCMIAGGLLTAGLLMIGNLPAPFLIGISHFLWCLGALTAGQKAGFHGRRHGIRTGFFCGVLFCCLLFAGHYLFQETDSGKMALRCILILLSGTAGGVWGVNTRLKKPPY